MVFSILNLSMYYMKDYYRLIVTPIITLFIQLSGHVDNFGCKSPPLLPHPVAQKSPRQGKSFELFTKDALK